MDIRFLPFGDFSSSAETAEEGRMIRREVFVVEQGVDEALEQDGKDPECAHLVGFIGDVSIAAMRMRRTEEGLKFERIAVLKEYRGKGYGKLLIEHALELFCGELIYIHAQEHAAGFYAALGFTETGEKTVEAGIPHVTMKYSES